MYQPSPGFPAHTPAATDSATPTNTIQQQQPPPPLPPRQQTQQQPPINYSTALYNNNNCSNPYNSYNPYNNYNNGYYNNYSYNNSNYTYANNNNNNTFSQQAETTTRQAFESVESVVRTFSSIAMMLDSTYQVCLFVCVLCLFRYVCLCLYAYIFGLMCFCVYNIITFNKNSKKFKMPRPFSTHFEQFCLFRTTCLG